ncbi:MAG TPA: integrin alpha, partial [Chthoniobacterales bacterium]|nr:integrin alpha [Chthoniobacterales bacterium]
MNFLQGRPLKLGKNQLFQKLLTLPAIYALAFATTAAGVTVLDPDPEVSTTEFGYSVVSIGDITGDGIPDLAVGAPFQDGDFVSIAMGYGFPQNVGKVYLVDGANHAILNMLTDPEFDLVQAQHFGGQLGFSLAAVGDLDNDGVTEILAGVHHHIGDPDHKEEINCGKALVFSGKTGMLLFTLEDPDEQEDGRFGAAVAGLGDINGDGVPD